MIKKFNTKVIEAEAIEITLDMPCHECGANSMYVVVDGVMIHFDYYQPVMLGDYIVYLKDNDSYHCPLEMFRDMYEVNEVLH